MCKHHLSCRSPECNMSFKRTSKAYREGAIVAENSCEDIYVECFSSRQETVSPGVDDSNNTPTPILNSMEARGSPLIDSASSGHLPSLESAYITVEEACAPQQEMELNDLGTKSCHKKDGSDDNACSNLDLCSEKSCQIGNSNVGDAVSDRNMVNCIRCQKLEKEIKAKQSTIDDINKRLQDLMHKHKMFVLSNCQLNEENDSLKTENDRLRLELRGLEFKNSRLRSEKDEIFSQLASKEDHPLITRGVSFTSQHPIHPVQNDDTNSDEQLSSAFRANLKEAVVLSHRQQNDVKLLRGQVMSQNRTIKMLCAQIQNSGRKPQRAVHSADLLQRSKQKGISDEELLRRTTMNKSTECIIETVRPELRKSVVEDGDDTIHLKDDNDEYIGDVFNKLEIKPPKETQRTVTTQPRLVTYKKSVAETLDNQFETNHRLHKTKPQPSVPIGTEALASEETSRPTIRKNFDFDDRLFQVEVMCCPLCGKKFSGFGEEFRRSFQNHVADCNCSQQHQCPLCFKTFPRSMPTEYFERHVEGHFGDNFEVLERTS